MPFLIFKEEYKAKGATRLLLSNLHSTVFHDYSLRIACFPFNCGDNPNLAGQEPAWVAVIANVHYQPFLAKRFPQGRWIRLSENPEDQENNYDGGLMLAIIPFTPQNQTVLLEWKKANDRLDLLGPFLNLPPEAARQEALVNFTQAGPDIGPDPFLQSCYWDS